MKTKMNFMVMAVLLIAVTFAGCHRVPINPGTVPEVTTNSATSITKTSAILNGKVVNTGSHDITARGFYYSPDGPPTDQDAKVSSGVGSGKFSSTLVSLKLNTTYYYMAYATNSVGTSFGQSSPFTTNNRNALLSISYSNLTTNTVKIQTEITPYGSKINEAGVVYSASDTTPTINDTKVVSEVKTGKDTISITGLTSNGKYFIRAYVITSTGVIYSPEVKIWTYAVMDNDGNGYHTVKIDGRVWTRENLKVTHYNNGDLIPEVKDSVKWYNDKSGARCYYDNNQTKYDSVYGALYNWYVVNDPRGIVPQGWHVPTIQEYGDLTLFLGNDIKGGGPMKEAGTQHWKYPNTGATNSSGFTGLPAGDRGSTRAQQTVIIFADVHEATAFWSSSRSPLVEISDALVLYYNHTWVNLNAYDNFDGFSIRLVQDK